MGLGRHDTKTTRLADDKPKKDRQIVGIFFFSECNGDLIFFSSGKIQGKNLKCQKKLQNIRGEISTV